MYLLAVKIVKYFIEQIVNYFHIRWTFQLKVRNEVRSLAWTR